MTTRDGNSVTLQHIYDLQLDTAGKVGDLHGRMGSLEVELRGVRSAVVEQGKRVAAVEQVCASRGDHCARRFKRISEAVHGVTETTGVVQLDGIKRRHTLMVLAKIGAALLALATAAGAFLGGHSCGEAGAPAKVIPLPMPTPPVKRKPSARLMDIDEGVKDLQSRLPRMEWFNIGVHPRRR